MRRLLLLVKQQIEEDLEELQSPEGDWADCDLYSGFNALGAGPYMKCCNPPKGIGLIATIGQNPSALTSVSQYRVAIPRRGLG